MKRKIACTLVGATGALSGSFIFQACEKAESADELNQMLMSNSQTVSDIGATGVPIGIPLTLQDQDYIRFLRQLSSEIICNPIAAQEFANNPEAYCQKFGYSHQLNLDQGLIKLIMALGDKELNDSINNKNVNAFVKACKKNGLLEFTSLYQDPYLMKISDYIYQKKSNSSLTQQFAQTRAEMEADLEIVDNFSGVYGAVAVVIAAIAVEAFIVMGTTTWITHVHQSAYQEVDYQNQNSMIEVWDLKNSGEEDFFITNKINEAIVEEGLQIIKENFPEIYEAINENTLRNIILLNISKNCVV